MTIHYQAWGLTAEGILVLYSDVSKSFNLPPTVGDINAPVFTEYTIDTAPSWLFRRQIEHYHQIVHQVN